MGMLSVAPLLCPRSLVAAAFTPMSLLQLDTGMQDNILTTSQHCGSPMSMLSAALLLSRKSQGRAQDWCLP